MPLREILDFVKFIPFLLPTLNLGLVLLQQSTSGLLLALVSALHVFSNPIDAIWSILFRQEVLYRCLVLSTSHLPDVSREFAAVLFTYDQWLQDARSHVSRVLAARRRFLEHRNIDCAVLITDEEKYLIRHAALRLRSCRPDGVFHTRLSIISFLASLAIVAYRVLSSSDGYIQREAGHILSLIAIFSHLVFAICINGYVGAFLYQEEATRVIFDLCTSLTALHNNPLNAFTLLPLPLLVIPRRQSSVTARTPAEFFRSFAARGSTAGTLNTLRARNTEKIVDGEGRDTSTLFMMSLCAVLISCLGVFAVLLLTSINPSIPVFLAFGICFLLWITNWILSAVVSCFDRRKSVENNAYSYLLTGSDAVFAVLILCSLGWSLTTWPGTTAIDPTVPTLTTVALLVVIFLLPTSMLLLVFCATFGRRNVGLVYLRSQEEALADMDAISMLPTRHLTV
ncbi:uncharacterized protein PV07_03003 [Cladophialophora immunda]|uniref:Uncharacterized protein n=1 Tax=Cladophialophora immunda TaxID=569365 RepID=A0A0D1ZTB3_9EURO|nr:uncharacterized protein PV07_03003 [Cladophialophora immunda]KIW31346.1 hypothetical protein PV07_03003 [Cladophialophora immunda]